MEKRIVYTRPDGGVSVVVPATDYLEEVYIKSIPADATNVHECLASDIPASRAFRDAWKQAADKSLEVDMPKARIMVTDQVRAERDKRLVAEDVAYMRADELGNAAEKQKVKTKKQKLRDLPDTIQSELASIDKAEQLEVWQPSWPE